MFLGTSPYVFDNKKFEGSIAWFNLDLPSLFPKPTLSGIGNTSSSTLSEDPAPNWISKIPVDINLVANLFGTFFIFKR